MIAARVADLWEAAETSGILALQIIEGRPIDRAARAMLPPDVLAALADPVTRRELRAEFFGPDNETRPRRRRPVRDREWRDRYAEALRAAA